MKSGKKEAHETDNPWAH